MRLICMCWGLSNRSKLQVNLNEMSSSPPLLSTHLQLSDLERRLFFFFSCDYPIVLDLAMSFG